MPTVTVVGRLSPPRAPVCGYRAPRSSVGVCPWLLEPEEVCGRPLCPSCSRYVGSALFAVHCLDRHSVACALGRRHRAPPVWFFANVMRAYDRTVVSSVDARHPLRLGQDELPAMRPLRMHTAKVLPCHERHCASVTQRWRHRGAPC